MVIEFTDVLKVGLVGAALFSGFALFLSIAAVSLSVLTTKGNAVWEYVISAIFLWGVIALSAYANYLPSGLVALGVAGWAVFVFVKEFAGPRRRIWWLITIGSLFVFTIFASGVAVGRNVKETLRL